jgi:thymidine phosphorylase
LDALRLPGEAVVPGEALAWVHAADEAAAEAAASTVITAMPVADAAPPAQALVREILRPA